MEDLVKYWRDEADRIMLKIRNSSYYYSNLSEAEKRDWDYRMISSGVLHRCANELEERIKNEQANA